LLLMLTLLTLQERDIAVVPSTHLVEVRGEQQQAIFDCLDPSGTPTGQQQVVRYDLLHVTPAHVPALAVANSSLANAEGWVAVDKETLQVGTPFGVY
jgi:sulfide:quinone oxidoreductase